jgi:hypothetical protein
MKMSSKWITSAAIGIGSFALALGSVGVAQAHNSEGGSGTGGGKRGGPQSSLIADGTITQAQADAVRTAVKEALTATEAGVLAQLVQNGTLTQTQADAIAAAETRRDKGALIQNGTVSESQLQALRAEIHEAMEAGKGQVLQSLVTDGTITQSQADAIAEAKSQGRRGMRGEGSQA